MKGYKRLTKDRKRGNPTQKTQKEILNVIRKSGIPMSITAIADKSGKGLYATKQTIEFLKGFGIIKTIVSSGNMTIVLLNKSGVENAK